jgi:hypothetical protein
MSENTNPPAAVTNLRDTKKAMAAAKKAHPAGKAAPATKTPARAPAKKAPAEASTGRKTPTRSDKARLRWQKQGTSVVAVAGDTTYAVVKSKKDGSKFAGTVKKEGQAANIVIDQVSGSRAYAALMRLHHYGEMPEAKKAAAKKASA